MTVPENGVLARAAHNSYFKKGTDAYKAVSAVNELMFAYSDDSAVSINIWGYTVSPYKTDYMAEFEYAAQYAIRQGAGAYVVAPTDYGGTSFMFLSCTTRGDVY